MPHVRLPLRLPLRVLGNHELEVRIRGALLARDPTGFHLDEVRLEEVDLVLAVHARRVGVLAHHREVVVHLAAVDSRLGLRDQSVPKREESGVSRFDSVDYRRRGGEGRGGVSPYSVRLMFCPFQKAVLSSVNLAPCLDTVSAGFL